MHNRHKTIPQDQTIINLILPQKQTIKPLNTHNIQMIKIFLPTHQLLIQSQIDLLQQFFESY